VNFEPRVVQNDYVVLRDDFNNDVKKLKKSFHAFDDAFDEILSLISDTLSKMLFLWGLLLFIYFILHWK